MEIRKAPETTNNFYNINLNAPIKPLNNKNNYSKNSNNQEPQNAKPQDENIENVWKNLKEIHKTLDPEIAKVFENIFKDQILMEKNHLNTNKIKSITKTLLRYCQQPLLYQEAIGVKLNGYLILLTLLSENYILEDHIGGLPSDLFVTFFKTCNKVLLYIDHWKKEKKTDHLLQEPEFIKDIEVVMNFFSFFYRTQNLLVKYIKDGNESISFDNIKTNSYFIKEMENLYKQHFKYPGKQITSKNINIKEMGSFSQVFINKEAKFNLEPFIPGLMTSSTNLKFFKELENLYEKRNVDNLNKEDQAKQLNLEENLAENFFKRILQQNQNKAHSLDIQSFWSRALHNINYIFKGLDAQLKNKNVILQDILHIKPSADVNTLITVKNTLNKISVPPTKFENYKDFEKSDNLYMIWIAKILDIREKFFFNKNQEKEEINTKKLLQLNQLPSQNEIKKNTEKKSFTEEEWVIKMTLNDPNLLSRLYKLLDFINYIKKIISPQKIEEINPMIDFPQLLQEYNEIIKKIKLLSKNLASLQTTQENILKNEGEETTKKYENNLAILSKIQEYLEEDKKIIETLQKIKPQETLIVESQWETLKEKNLEIRLTLQHQLVELLKEEQDLILKNEYEEKAQELTEGLIKLQELNKYHIDVNDNSSSSDDEEFKKEFHKSYHIQTTEPINKKILDKIHKDIELVNNQITKLETKKEKKILNHIKILSDKMKKQKDTFNHLQLVLKTLNLEPVNEDFFTDQEKILKELKKEKNHTGRIPVLKITIQEIEKNITKMKERIQKKQEEINILFLAQKKNIQVNLNILDQLIIEAKNLELQDMEIFIHNLQKNKEIYNIELENLHGENTFEIEINRNLIHQLLKIQTYQEKTKQFLEKLESNILEVKKNKDKEMEYQQDLNKFNEQIKTLEDLINVAEKSGIDPSTITKLHNDMKNIENLEKIHLQIENTTLEERINNIKKMIEEKPKEDPKETPLDKSIISHPPMNNNLNSSSEDSNIYKNNDQTHRKLNEESLRIPEVATIETKLPITSYTYTDNNLTNTTVSSPNNTEQNINTYETNHEHLPDATPNTNNPDNNTPIDASDLLNKEEEKIQKEETNKKKNNTKTITSALSFGALTSTAIAMNKKEQDRTEGYNEPTNYDDIYTAADNIEYYNNIETNDNSAPKD